MAEEAVEEPIPDTNPEEPEHTADPEIEKEPSLESGDTSPEGAGSADLSEISEKSGVAEDHEGTTAAPEGDAPTEETDETAKDEEHEEGLEEEPKEAGEAVEGEEEEETKDEGEGKDEEETVEGEDVKEEEGEPREKGEEEEEGGDGEPVYQLTTEETLATEYQSPTPSKKSLAETAEAEEAGIKNALDELTDNEFLQLMEEMETANRHLNLENRLFENFLLNYDPTALDDMEEFMELLNPLNSSNTGSQSSQTRSSKSSSSPRRSSAMGAGRSASIFSPSTKKFKLDSFVSLASIAEGKGPRINLMQKSEMIQKATDEIQSSLSQFQRRSHITIRNLKCELEEFAIRAAELKESIDLFEYQVVTQGVDKLTQRIPAEKFIRYMEEWLKAATLQIEKLRLRLATMRLQYKKVSQTLIQRQELRENVHAVDFDQLEIENKHLIDKIEQKNSHLIELKKINGSANLVLCHHKNYLQGQQDECYRLKEQIAIHEKIIQDTQVEVNDASVELEIVEDRHTYYKKIQSKYTVPDVLEYINLKEKLYELKKNIKVWARRKKIQDIALAACIRELKRVTGYTEIDLTWYDTKSVESSEYSGSCNMLPPL